MPHVWSKPQLGYRFGGGTLIFSLPTGIDITEALAYSLCSDLLPSWFLQLLLGRLTSTLSTYLILILNIPLDVSFLDWLFPFFPSDQSMFQNASWADVIYSLSVVVLPAARDSSLYNSASGESVKGLRCMLQAKGQRCGVWWEVCGSPGTRT